MRITLEDVEKERNPEGSVNSNTEEEKEQGSKDRRSFKDKWCYFWDYYKWYVIIPAILVYVVTSLTITIINENKDASLYIVFTNTSDVLEPQEEIMDKYVTEREINTKKNPVVFIDGIYYPAGLSENSYISQDTSASMQKYTTLITKNKADVTFTTSWVAEAYQLNDCFADLRDIFGEEFVEENADKFFYFDRVKAEKGMEDPEEALEDAEIGDSDGGDLDENRTDDGQNEDVELIPIGIYADNWSKMGRFYEDEKPIMVIDVDGTNTEEAVKFVQWVLQQE